jgi:UDP-N-acetylmuramoyl-tripeptide--D-alanyl-D-alanine ligase
VATLRAIAEPEVAIVTSIGEEHLEGFGDLAGVLREESAVFDGVALAVTPASQPEIADAARGRAGAVVAAGLDAGDVHPDRWGLDEDGRGWLAFGDRTIRVPLRGEHNLRNAMLALAVADRLGIGLDDAARGLEATPVLPMRMDWRSLGSLTVINDAYNANPASARESIRLLDGLTTTRQRVLVLATMLELGPQGPALHDEIARAALASRVDIVAGVGEFARALGAADGGASGERVVTAGDVPELWPLLSTRITPDAIVLLKGSRGMRLERMVPLLGELGGVAAGDEQGAPTPH